MAAAGSATARTRVTIRRRSGGCRLLGCLGHSLLGDVPSDVFGGVVNWKNPASGDSSEFVPLTASGGTMVVTSTTALSALGRSSAPQLVLKAYMNASATLAALPAGKVLGQRLMIWANNTGTLTVQHSTGALVQLTGGANVTLTNNATLSLFWDGTYWRNG